MNDLTIYHWVLLSGFAICFISCFYKLISIIRAGVPVDYAEALGKTGPAIKYSFTGAMSPKKKETAFLHLPTYIAGILYHLGTFLGFFIIILIFLNVELNNFLIYIPAIFLAISGISGLAIFFKRVFNPKMLSLSNPDDFISNLLVTGFQLLLAIVLLVNNMYPVLFIYTTLLFLYIPIGKLRHLVYFFSSRYHLGVFYGRRGVWPVNNKN